MNDKTASAYPLDVSMLDGFRAMQSEGAADLVRELCDMFRSAAPPLMDAIRNAIAQDDSDMLYKSAHTLKGSSATMGARFLADQLQELEHMGRMRDLAGASEILAQAEKEYARALTAMESECQKTGSA
jgi:HPt (histidine-containing phosphotransfer) domain-containing protein